MIKGLMLQSAVFAGGEIGDFLTYLDDVGFFSYLLPFLLIFSLVFGILSRLNLFKENRVANGLIAFVVGVLALQFEFVPNFFSEVFPRLGVALAIILVVLILVGLFLDPKNNAMMYSMLGVGAVILIIVLIQTAGALGWSSGYWWEENWKWMAAAIFILIVVGVIVAATNPKEPKQSESPLARALFGETHR